jgi:hypothetical protein
MSKATTSTTKPAVKRTNKTVTPDEQSIIIEGLRKLALQRDTLKKYALLAEAGEDNEDGDEVEYNGKSSAELTADITFIKETLAKLGDTRPLVLKSERKAKPAKGKAKAKKPAKASVKA